MSDKNVAKHSLRLNLRNEQHLRIQKVAYAEVISYNKKNLERELANESRQRNRQQGREKRREEEI